METTSKSQTLNLAIEHRRCLEQILQIHPTSAHWSCIPFKACSVQFIASRLGRISTEYALWRSQHGRVLLGLGDGKRLAYPSLRDASDAAKGRTDVPPITFFGACFDADFPHSSKRWADWPKTELYEPTVIFDWRHESHQTPNVWVMVRERAQGHAVLARLLSQNHDETQPMPPPQWTPEESYEDWQARLNRLQQVLETSPLTKVVMARAIRCSMRLTPNLTKKSLSSLLERAGDAYAYARRRPSGIFLGCTPETLVSLQDQHLTTHALAGTMMPGQNHQDFLTDEKIKREHHIVVSDVIRKLEEFSPHVETSAPQLKKAGTLTHLETKIAAKTKNIHLLDAIELLHPTPALGGAPTADALAWLRECEPLDRGWFGGPIGWFDRSGNGECGVAIRSALIDNREAAAFAGAGIVDGSDARAEWQETADKFSAILSVIGGVSP
ncbi:MAG: isochorismate synthase [Bradymonadia bacterium]